MIPFKDFVGMRVIYRSGSGREYPAIITAIPERPETSGDQPIVSLIYKDIRGKWKRKSRVLPWEAAYHKEQVWRYDQGKYAWKDGLFVDDDDLAEEEEI